jgi:two-component system response regulator
MKDGGILLVEDNPDDEALTLRALHRNGVTAPVSVVRDGAKALDHLLGGSVPLPRLVLLDLKLPKVSGLEVLRRVRADPRTRFLVVVVLTSSREEPDLVAAYAAGANSYIRKPVSFEAFTEAVGQLGRYWLLLNEDPPT